METQKSIIILSGPVGAGKTAVAQQLVKLLPEPVVCIEGDKFWGFIAKGVVGNRFTNFKMTIRSMILAAMPYSRSGYQVIVDFSIPPWYLETIQKILGTRNIPIDYVVIRPDLDICAERAAGRDEGKIEDYARYKDLYNSFDDVQDYLIYDNDGDAATIAGYIMEGLGDGTFRLQS